MPYKDKEAQRAKIREIMRQRRARAKGNPAEVILPPVSGGTALPPEMEKPAPVSKTDNNVNVPVSARENRENPVAPEKNHSRGLEKRSVASRDGEPETPVAVNLFGEAVVPAPSAPSTGVNSQDKKPRRYSFVPAGNYWSRFPFDTGRPCFNDGGYSCCYDLNFPVPWDRTYCPFGPETCNYAK